MNPFAYSANGMLILFDMLYFIVLFFRQEENWEQGISM